MFVYTTCRDCGDLLHTTRRDQTEHPDCKPQPTKLEALVADWLAAAESRDTQIANDLQQAIIELETRPPRLLEAALMYAGWGWPVFPLKPRSKQPATRHGFKDATTDQGQIRDWWTTNPQANIGLPTGIAFDVVDVDPPAGITSLDEMLAKVDPRTGIGVLNDCHGKVSTASGGWHLYTEPTGDGNTAGMRPGIDYRGQGGYVVAPPSQLEIRHHCWAWTVHPSPTIRQGW